MFVFTPVIVLFIVFVYVHPLEPIVKCCEHGFILNDFMKCEPILNTSNPLGSILDLSEVIININTTCFVSNDNKTPNSSTEVGRFLNLPCADIVTNGTLTFENCSDIRRRNERKSKQCKSLFTPLKFWGASIVVFATFIYILPYSTIVVIYCIMPDLRRKAYDKGVMCFCLTQVFIAAILCTLGYFVLCNKVVPEKGYSLAGLALMFLTISSVFWLLVFCFDVTLSITRFRWAPSDNPNRENRKFRFYACWIYGLTSVPTIFAGTLELVPLIPKDWSIKPNFKHFDDTNMAVIVYVATIPFIICIINSALFVYTSWKMFKIQKSISMAKENRENVAKKQYITYLKLYFLMDAPWLSSTLGAIYPDLWILKLFRIIHPILLLISILPRKLITRCVKWISQLHFIKYANTRKEANVTRDKYIARKDDSLQNIKE